MDKLAKSIARLLGHFTRLIKNAEELLVEELNEEVDFELELTIINLEEKIEGINDICMKIQEGVDEHNTEQLTKEFDYIPELSELYHRKNMNLEKKRRTWKLLNKTDGNGKKTDQPKIKLPPVTMRTFDGNIMEWRSFNDSFQSTVDANNTLSNFEKFHYLRSLLKGEALLTIEGLPMTDMNYSTVFQQLKYQFERPEKIIDAHIKQLEHMPRVNNLLDVEALRHLFLHLQSNNDALENLGVLQNTYTTILRTKVMRRLPSELQLKWSREEDVLLTDFKPIMVFLRKKFWL